MRRQGRVGLSLGVSCASYTKSLKQSTLQFVHAKCFAVRDTYFTIFQAQLKQEQLRKLLCTTATHSMTCANYRLHITCYEMHANTVSQVEIIGSSDCFSYDGRPYSVHHTKATTRWPRSGLGASFSI